MEHPGAREKERKVESVQLERTGGDSENQKEKKKEVEKRTY